MKRHAYENTFDARLGDAGVRLRQFAFRGSLGKIRTAPKA